MILKDDQLALKNREIEDLRNQLNEKNRQMDSLNGQLSGKISLINLRTNDLNGKRRQLETCNHNLNEKRTVIKNLKEATELDQYRYCAFDGINPECCAYDALKEILEKQYNYVDLYSFQIIYLASKSQLQELRRL